MCSSSWNNAFGQVYKFVMRVLLRRISVKGFQLHSIFFVDIIFTCAHFDTHGCRKPVSSLYSAFKSVSYVYQQVPIFVQVNGISENMPHLFIVFWMLIFFGFFFILFSLVFVFYFHFIWPKISLRDFSNVTRLKCIYWSQKMIVSVAFNYVHFQNWILLSLHRLHHHNTPNIHGMLYRIHQKSRNIPDNT